MTPSAAAVTRPRSRPRCGRPTRRWTWRSRPDPSASARAASTSGRTGHAERGDHQRSSAWSWSHARRQPGRDASVVRRSFGRASRPAGGGLTVTSGTVAGPGRASPQAAAADNGRGQELVTSASSAACISNPAGHSQDLRQRTVGESSSMWWRIRSVGDIEQARWVFFKIVRIRVRLDVAEPADPTSDWCEDGGTMRSTWNFRSHHTRLSRHHRAGAASFRAGY